MSFFPLALGSIFLYSFLVFFFSLVDTVRIWNMLPSLWSLIWQLNTLNLGRTDFILCYGESMETPECFLKSFYLGGTYPQHVFSVGLLTGFDRMCGIGLTLGCCPLWGRVLFSQLNVQCVKEVLSRLFILKKANLQC